MVILQCMQMVLLVDSLRHTGCGDAFAQLKVNSQQTAKRFLQMTSCLLVFSALTYVFLY